VKVKNKDGIEKEIIGQKLIVYNTVDNWKMHAACMIQRDGTPRIYPSWWTHGDIYDAVNNPHTIVTDTARRVRELVDDGLFEARKAEYPRKIYRIYGRRL